MLFRELISNYKLNQVADSKIAFYVKRLGRETVIRRSAALMLVLVLVFQFVTFASPPKPSNASGSNDIIPGGFSSKADLLAKWDAPGVVFGVGAIQVKFGYFGITRDNIAQATDTTS